LQELDETSSPTKNTAKNNNKSPPKRGKNSKSEKEAPSQKEKKSSTDEKNPRETAKNNRRKSDQKTNTTNTLADKSASDTPLKRGQKRKASSDENEGPHNKKQKTGNLSEDYDDVPFEESSASQRRRSGKSTDEKVDEILDIRAEQWHQIDQFTLERSESTGVEEKMAVYNSLTVADVNSPSSQQKLAQTTAVVSSKGKKVRFNAYSDLLSGDRDDLSFLTPDDGDEAEEKKEKKRQFFRNLFGRIATWTKEEQTAEIMKYYRMSQRKYEKDSDRPMQSTPVVQNKVRKAPKTAPNVMRTNALRNPTSPTKFNATKNKKVNDEQVDLVTEENVSPRRKGTAATPNKAKSSTTTTPKKGSETPKSASKASPNKSKASTPAKTPAKATPKNGRTSGTSTPSKAKSTPSKVAPKKASPKKSAAKPTRARARPTRFSL
jgi:hypothetical protein